MIDRGSLESILSGLQGIRWRGRAYRVMLNDYPPERENTQGARWNPPDLAAIYCCLDSAVCIAEVEYGLRRQSRPVRDALRRTLYEIDVALEGLADLATVGADLSGIGIGRAELFADDMKVSQEIGRIVTWLGFDGLLVPEMDQRSAGCACEGAFQTGSLARWLRHRARGTRHSDQRRWPADRRAAGFAAGVSTREPLCTQGRAGHVGCQAGECSG